MRYNKQLYWKGMSDMKHTIFLTQIKNGRMEIL